MFFASIFFAFLANLLVPIMWQIHNPGKNLGYIIGYLCLCAFVVFSIYAFCIAIGYRIVYLTTSELIIHIPVIFYKRTISLNNIKNFSESEEKFSYSKSVFSNKSYTIGHKTIFLLDNGTKATLSSLDMWGYNELIKKIHSQIRKAQ
jgi:hypothetical protein